MQTLDAPVYEVKPESQMYQDKQQQFKDIQVFYKALEEKYGMRDGFGFYHSDYFGIHSGTQDYERFKDELVKNPAEKNEFYPFRKRSKYYKEIKAMLQQVKTVSPFTPHDIFGLNNIQSSQWIGDRWFYQVKRKEDVQSEEVTPIDYKDYLKVVMDHLEEMEQAHGAD